MNKYTYIIPEFLDKERVDKALASLCQDFSRSQIQKSIKNKQLVLNGKIVEDISLKVKLDDYLEINLTEQIEDDVAPRQMQLDIVYEDEHLIVLNKAAGVTTHPGAGNHNDTLVNGLLYHSKQLSDIGGQVRPGIVHRLDKDTSGLMVVAKNNQVHANLAEQLQNRELHRQYQALIWGVIKPFSGTINMPIARSSHDRTKMTTVSHGGKEAITHYSTQEIFAGGIVSLVNCKLETGRTHQIRVHMSHNKHSVIGDQTYGNNDRKLNGCPDQLKNILSTMKRQALHSYYMSFTHPVTQEIMEFTQEVPQDYQYLLDSLRQL